MRTDAEFRKQKALSIRPDAVPGLRPSTIRFVNEVVKCEDKGSRAKKEFLLTKPCHSKGWTVIVRKHSSIIFNTNYTGCTKTNKTIQHMYSVFLLGIFSLILGEQKCW